KIADQMVERTYSYRIMNYFKVILCLSIEILSLKISKVKVSQLLNLIDNLMNTKLEIPLNISCET
ncbi:MAG: hypothetical protein SV062_05510, partial [Thermodesulfobacteriota bacterium]|nr:hypothetical protein [Thermodesulfobacteriota bacterium]